MLFILAFMAITGIIVSRCLRRPHERHDADDICVQRFTASTIYLLAVMVTG